MKYRDLKEGDVFTFTEPSDDYSLSTLYEKIDGRYFKKALIPEGHPPYLYKVKSIKKEVERILAHGNN